MSLQIQPSVTLTPLDPAHHYHGKLILQSADGQPLDIGAKLEQLQKRIEWLEETLKSRAPYELDTAS